MNPDARAVLVLDDLQLSTSRPAAGCRFSGDGGKLVGNFRSTKGYQPVALVDQRHPYAECGKDAGVLAADHTGPTTASVAAAIRSRTSSW